MWNVQNKQITRDKKQISGYQGLEEEENEEWLPNGWESLFWGIFWN